MKRRAASGRPSWSVLLGLLLMGAPAHPVWIPTNSGNGADTEVRESLPETNFGASNELGTRVIDAGSVGDRNSLLYVRFDLSTTAIPPFFETALRLTYRNGTLQVQRLVDLVTPDPSNRTGLSVYGLDPGATGVDWLESTIT